MTTPRIRLLRIPYVAQLEIIKQFFPGDLYHLSKTSTRLSGLVKSASKQLRLIQQFDFRLACNYGLKMGDSSDVGSFKDSKVYYLQTNADWSISYNEEVLQEIHDQIVYFSDIFNKPKITLNFFEPSQIVPIMSSVRELGLETQDVCACDTDQVDSPPVSVKQYKSLLYGARTCSRLHLHLTPPRNLPLVDLPEFRMDSFVCNNAPWVTIDHLIYNFINCKKVELHDTTIRSRDFYKFVKAWIENSTMEEMVVWSRLTLQDWHHNEIFGDIRYQRMEVRMTTRDNEHKSGFAIRANDGKEAVVILDGGFTMATEFEVLTD